MYNYLKGIGPTNRVLPSSIQEGDVFLVDEKDHSESSLSFLMISQSLMPLHRFY